MTINAGLRYDLTLFPPVGTNKQIGVNGGPETGDIDFNTGTYIVQKLPPPCSVRGFAPCIPGDGTLPANVVVSPNEKIVHNTPTNVGPHLGFALKVRENLVLHAAAGIVYDNWAGVLQLAQNVDGLWPDIGQQEPTGLNVPTASSPTPTVTSQNPLASSGSGTFVPAPTPFTQQGFEYDPRMKNPYSEQWSFGVQQLIGSSTTVTVNYVGSSTHRMDVGGIYGGALTPGTGPIAAASTVSLHYTDVLRSQHRPRQLQRAAGLVGEEIHQRSLLLGVLHLVKVHRCRRRRILRR